MKSDIWRDNAEIAHRYYDAHAQHFSSGLKQLLAAHAELQKHGISFLSIREPIQPVLRETVDKKRKRHPESRAKIPVSL